MPAHLRHNLKQDKIMHYRVKISKDSPADLHQISIWIKWNRKKAVTPKVLGTLLPMRVLNALVFMACGPSWPPFWCSISLTLP